MMGMFSILSVGELTTLWPVPLVVDLGVAEAPKGEPERDRNDLTDAVGLTGVVGREYEPYVCEIARRGGVESRAGGVKRKSVGVELCL
jgi:hypothetical protein